VGPGLGQGAVITYVPTDVTTGDVGQVRMQQVHNNGAEPRAEAELRGDAALQHVYSETYSRVGKEAAA
jgi:hypothetical protein